MHFELTGEVKEIWLMLKGCCVGVKKRPLISQKSVMKHASKKQLKTIDIEGLVSPWRQPPQVI